MNKTFVDSSWWKALVDEKDDFYVIARATNQRLNKEPLVMMTTDYIVDESLTLIRSKCGLDKCRKLIEVFRGYGQQLRFERVLIRDDKRALELFWKPWRGLSYTDCTSFAVMERLGIKQALTFDEHFSDAGFKIVK